MAQRPRLTAHLTLLFAGIVVTARVSAADIAVDMAARKALRFIAVYATRNLRMASSSRSMPRPGSCGMAR
jgi:hypothetical protein